MTRFLYIVLALALSACNHSEEPRSVLVNLNATGKIELVPDMASFTVNLSCIDKDLTTSTACVKNNIVELFAMLDQHKVSKQDYHSSRINLDKKYIWKNNSQVFQGYQSSSTVNVVIKDLDSIGALLANMMQMKNAELYGLNYSHSELEAYSNQAYLKALDNAASLSDEIKTKLGAKTARIIKISNINSGFDGPEPVLLEKREFKSLRANASQPVQVNPGSLTLVKDVYVQYRVYYQ